MIRKTSKKNEKHLQQCGMHNDAVFHPSLVDTSIKQKKNEKKSEQAHIPHAPTLLENAVYNEWQF